MKLIGIVFLLFVSLSGMAQQAETLKEYVTKRWEDFKVPEKEVAKAILAEREQIARYIKANGASREAVQENGAQAIRRVADLYDEGKDARLKASVIKKVLKGVDLSSKEFVKCSGLEFVVEDYYGLKAVMEGAPAEEAWGSMWFNTTVETIGNDYDYRRYRQILELNNPELSLAYLSCLRSVFRYNGYTKGLDELRPLFEKNMPEGDLKDEINKLYEGYEHLKEGNVAPAFTLKDFKGKEHSLADYKGKVLVIDVWATWCGGCIAKLPTYMAMSQKYKERDDIEFITISIDDKGAFNSWKYALPRLKLMGVTNLLASKGECTFQKDYNITGIPRYFLIDKEGKIVSVYAPTPGKAFEALIDKTLEKYVRE
ncbi:TlpA disulfide reductase family protein [Butyricimonas hominis]|uniref:Redoxin family protein n=1 Tax=Butyricimonas hominis TaxID=2763032 RepID=A0ABR7D4F3_9BACT|nr:TlpA disulfide reductase family protein [Butyricimonas hominis]MBC5622831.1 redoxin family protein [Butyricimonas hominis]